MSWQRQFIAGRFQRVYVAPPAELPPFEFDQQRATCEACALSKSIPGTHGVTELRCGFNGRTRASCSAQRLPDGACGAEARHFVARAA